MNWLIGKLIGGAVTASTPLRMVMLAKLVIYVAAALIGVATVFGSLYWIRGLRLDAAIGNAAKAQAALSLCADANTANADAIALLQGNLNECVGTAQRIAQARVEMEAARRDLLDRQERELRALRAQRDRDYASDTECGALRAVPVCRGVADRLRSLAGQNADG